MRNPDKDVSRSYSEHHGWVYGYGIHLTVTVSGFPTDVIAGTASVSESEVIDRKAGFIKDTEPDPVTAGNSYRNLSRIREWAKSGIAPVTPGKKTGSAGYEQSETDACQRNRRCPHISDHRNSDCPVCHDNQQHIRITDPGNILYHSNFYIN